MQELLGRIARLDPSASLGLRVIACFDELIVGNVNTRALLATAAALAGCTAGSRQSVPPRTLRVTPKGEAVQGESPTDSSNLHVASEDGIDVWLERDGAAGPNDALILERLALAVRIRKSCENSNAAWRSCESTNSTETPSWSPATSTSHICSGSTPTSFTTSIRGLGNLVGTAKRRWRWECRIAARSFSTPKYAACSPRLTVIVPLPMIATLRSSPSPITGANSPAYIHSATGTPEANASSSTAIFASQAGHWTGHRSTPPLCTQHATSRWPPSTPAISPPHSVPEFTAWARSRPEHS